MCANHRWKPNRGEGRITFDFHVSVSSNLQQIWSCFYFFFVAEDPAEWLAEPTRTRHLSALFYETESRCVSQDGPESLVSRDLPASVSWAAGPPHESLHLMFLFGTKNTSSVIVLLSCSYCNKFPKIFWHKRAELFSLNFNWYGKMLPICGIPFIVSMYVYIVNF